MAGLEKLNSNQQISTNHSKLSIIQWLNKNLFLIIGAIVVLLFNCTQNKSATEYYELGSKEVLNNNKKAYKLFKKAIKLDKSNAQYHWAAANTAPNRNLSFIHTNQAWENGLRNKSTMFAYAKLSFHTTKKQKLDFCLELFKKLPDDLQNNEMMGEIYFRFQEYDSTFKFWNKIPRESLSAENRNNYARALTFVNDSKGAIEILENDLKTNIINEEGYALLISLYSSTYEYEKAKKVYKTAKSRKSLHPLLKIEYIVNLIALDKYKEAQTLCFDILSNINDSNYNDNIYKRAILLLYTIAINTQTPSLIDSLEVINIHTNKNDKKAFKSFYNNDKKLLEHVLKVSQKNVPELTLLLSRAYTKKHMPKKAIDTYSKLPRSYLYSPRVTVELATQYAKLGKDTIATQLIDKLHSNKIFTRASLELYRDISLRNNQIEKSHQAQKMLEKYSGDFNTIWKGINLEIKNGNLDKALSKAYSAHKNFPEKIEIEKLIISIHILKKDYKRALKLCNASSLSKDQVLLLKFDIYSRKEIKDSARILIEESIKINPTAEALFKYAEFNIKEKSHNDVSSTLNKLLSDHPNFIKKYPKRFATILNNHAWYLIEHTTDKNKIINNYLNTALDLSQNNPYIIDTYAEFYLKNHEYKNCISLLEKYSCTNEEQRLTWHLSKAYSGINNNTKALKLLYRLSDKKNYFKSVLPHISEEDINNEILILKEKKN